VLVLDSGGVTRLSQISSAASGRIVPLRDDDDLWPPVVPSVVLVDCLQGPVGKDAAASRFLKTCNIVADISEPLARRAALLRRLARRGSAVDALVVAMAEPDGTVLTSDVGDLEALAEHATRVVVQRI
jgi:hypothetical protein